MLCCLVRAAVQSGGQTGKLHGVFVQSHTTIVRFVNSKMVYKEFDTRWTGQIRQKYVPRDFSTQPRRSSTALSNIRELDNPLFRQAEPVPEGVETSRFYCNTQATHHHTDRTVSQVPGAAVGYRQRPAAPHLPCRHPSPAGGSRHLARGSSSGSNAAHARAAGTGGSGGSRRSRRQQRQQR